MFMYLKILLFFVYSETQFDFVDLEKELKQVQELFNQATDNCLNLKKPEWIKLLVHISVLMELIRQYLLKEALFLEYALEEQQIVCVGLLWVHSLTGHI